MVVRPMNGKVIITILFIAVLILILVVFGLNARSNLMFKENRELREEISRLTIKGSALTEKLNTDMSELLRERAELEKTRNKLTQERLKNRQLLQEKEELEEAVSAYDVTGEPEAS